MKSPFADVPHDFRITPQAFAKVQRDDVLDGVRRHLAHDWGLGRHFSLYRHPTAVKPRWALTAAGAPPVAGACAGRNARTVELLANQPHYVMESPFVERMALAFAASTNAFVKIQLDDLRAALLRYAAHDWGDVSADTRRYNQESLAKGGQFYAQYTDRNGVTFYITSTTSDVCPMVSLTRDDE